MATDYEVAIVGGGVIGLAIAHALTASRADRRIVVLEKRDPPREASWAAGGMLSPFSEFHTDTALFHLSRASADLYPDYVHELRAETGLPCTMANHGSLMLHVDESDAIEIDIALRFLMRQDVEFALLDRADLHEREPNLAGAVQRALWLPERAVNNRQLWDALAEACRRRGVHVRLGEELERVQRTGARIDALHAASGEVRAETVVLAAGAWSRTVGAEMGVTLPVLPIKGQMMRFDAPDDTVRHTLHHQGTYVIPHSGAGVVVGSTMEAIGFNRKVEPAVIKQLGGRASALVPAFAAQTPSETWCGFRPKTPDGWPILGRMPGVENLVLATGHFRNGILLAPITGRLIADVIDGTPTEHVDEFVPTRFTTIA